MKWINDGHNWYRLVNAEGRIVGVAKEFADEVVTELEGQFYGRYIDLESAKKALELAAGRPAS